MINPRFEKQAFKKEVKNNVKTLFRKTIEEATPQQLFQAVSYAVKDVIIDDWIKERSVDMLQKANQNLPINDVGIHRTQMQKEIPGRVRDGRKKFRKYIR